MLHDQLLNSALDMARRGFKVFPVSVGNRRPPAISGWQIKATTEESQIRQWWSERNYNVGVLMDEGLIAVDIDVKAGKQGAESFRALQLTTEERDTFRVRTASGGWHVYYSTDDDLGNSPGDLGPGIDIRGGRNGYVVGPGSVLTNGSGEGTYTIEHDSPLRPLPETIRARLRTKPQRAERSDTPLFELDQTDAIRRSTDYLATCVAAVQGQNGDLTTYKIAARLKDFGLSRESAFELMLEHWNDRCSPPWELEELQEKVEHAYLYGNSPPGVDHPAVAFSGVDVEPAPTADVQPSRWFRHGDEWDRNVRWLYHEVLPAVGVAVIVGAPQSGKTFVDVELGRSVAAGKPFFGIHPDDRGGVAYLFAGTEGSALPMRLAALCEHDALPISATSVSDLSARGALGKLLEDLRVESKRMQDNFGVPLRLVVLETLNASGLLVDENDNAEIGMAFANLGTLSRDLDALVLTTHHPPKNGEGARGGGAIVASADYVLEITREGTDAVRYLDLTKARDAEQRQLGTFTLLKTDLGEDSRGRPITSMTVSMGEPMVKRGGRRASHAEHFMQALEFALLESTTTPDSRAAAEWEAVLRNFNDIRPGGKGGNSLAVFRRCVDYAKDVGAIDTGIFAGERYIWKKEIDGA